VLPCHSRGTLRQFRHFSALAMAAFLCFRLAFMIACLGHENTLQDRIE
jgi:hypothetical protein